MKKHHDVLVVGSGPLGITVARRLAEWGLQVIVLEAGSAITDPPGSHLRNQPGIRQDTDGYFAAIEQYLQPVTDSVKRADLPGAADSSLVGGQGILWTNNCPRFERWVDLGALRIARPAARSERCPDRRSRAPEPD